MDKKVAVSKINTMGKVGRIVAVIAKIILIVGVVGCIVGVVALLMIPKGAITYKANGGFDAFIDVEKLVGSEKFSSIEIDKMQQAIDEHVTMDIVVNGIKYGDTSVNVNDKGVISASASGSTRTVDVKNVAVILIMGIIYLGVSIVSVTFFEMLFKSLATCVTPFSEDVIKGLKRFAFSLIPWVFMGIMRSVIAGIVTSSRLDLKFDVNITMIAVVLIILALAYIFSYGAVLQQESDETL